jgi:hypothetical protein
MAAQRAEQRAGQRAESAPCRLPDQDLRSWGAATLQYVVRTGQTWGAETEALEQAVQVSTIVLGGAVRNNLSPVAMDKIVRMRRIMLSDLAGRQQEAVQQAAAQGSGAAGQGGKGGGGSKVPAPPRPPAYPPPTEYAKPDIQF